MVAILQLLNTQRQIFTDTLVLPFHNAVELTAMGGDGDWKFDWVEYAEQNPIYNRNHLSCKFSNCFVISSVNDISFLIAPESHGLLRTLVLDYDVYHEFEVNTLAFYKMMEYIE